MEKNLKKELESMNIQEIVGTIIEAINEKCVLTDSTVQKYEDKLSNDLAKILKQISKKDEFNLKIVSDPHEYAKSIIGTSERLINYNGRECVEEELCMEQIIGDAKVNKNDARFKKIRFFIIKYTN